MKIMETFRAGSPIGGTACQRRQILFSVLLGRLAQPEIAEGTPIYPGSCVFQLENQQGQVEWDVPEGFVCLSFGDFPFASINLRLFRAGEVRTDDGFTMICGGPEDSFAFRLTRDKAWLEIGSEWTVRASSEFTLLSPA